VTVSAAVIAGLQAAGKSGAQAAGSVMHALVTIRDYPVSYGNSHARDFRIGMIEVTHWSIDMVAQCTVESLTAFARVRDASTMEGENASRFR